MNFFLILLFVGLYLTKIPVLRKVLKGYSQRELLTISTPEVKARRSLDLKSMTGGKDPPCECSTLSYIVDAHVINKNPGNDLPSYVRVIIAQF